MRWIYLSPHLDDAALSAGGLIFDQTQAGTPVEIWTFMCGDPHLTEYSSFASKLHADWGFADAEETVRLRRIEDQQAAEILGAQVVHFDFLDCIYRRGKNGAWLYKEIAIPPLPDDADLPAQIASAITPRLLPDDVLVTQLAVGSHVDHVLVRMAAELLGRPLVYDIDIPYLFYKPHEFEPKSAGMQEETHRISEAGLERWQDAVLAYKSQLPALGEALSTPEATRESIRSYWEEWKGIRLLHRVTTP
jgi:LmbE family N-acetylglucosaminyl deacetylase